MKKKILLLFLSSLLVVSCSTSTNLSIKNHILNNYELRVDDGTFTKNIKINLNFGLKIKDVSSGQLEKSLVNVQSIKIIISKNPYSPFNEVTKDLTITSISSTINFTLSGLQANTNYYIAVRAYSNSTPDENYNITQNETSISSEYIQIDNNGNLSIINDNSNNIIDINLKLKDRIGVRADSFVKIKDGNLGVFSINSPIEASSNGNKPKVFVNSKGNGLILSYKYNVTNYYIEGVKVKDYEVSSDPIIFSDNTNTFNITDLSFETDEDGNGILIFSRKLDSSNPDHIFYKEINKYNPNNGIETRLDTNPDTENLESPITKLSHDNTRGVVAWNKYNSTYDLCFTSFTTNPINISGTQTCDSNNINDFDISKPDTNGDFAILGVRYNLSSEYQVILMKANTNLSYPSIIDNLTNLSTDIKSNPQIYLDPKGDGIAFWVEESGVNKIIKYRGIFNFYPTTKTISLYETTNSIYNLSLSLNQQGNGIISWLENNQVYINPIHKFNPSYDKEILSSSFTIPTSINLHVNNLSQGLVVVEDSSQIYYQRIFNKSVQ